MSSADARSGLAQRLAAWRRSGVPSLLLVVALAWLGSGLLRSYFDRGAAAELRTLARPGDIRLISSVTCVYCAQARAWLTEQQVPFSECLIERDAACLAEYRTLGARGTPTVLVRGEVLLGFDARRVSAVLAAAGSAGEAPAPR